eukprot:850096-Amorphochlora_amoeboformis.AAC.2
MSLYVALDQERASLGGTTGHDSSQGDREHADVCAIVCSTEGDAWVEEGEERGKYHGGEQGEGEAQISGYVSPYT